MGGAQGIFKAVKLILSDAITVDTYHYTFVQTQ